MRILNTQKKLITFIINEMKYNGSIVHTSTPYSQRFSDLEHFFVSPLLTLRQPDVLFIFIANFLFLLSEFVENCSDSVLVFCGIIISGWKKNKKK